MYTTNLSFAKSRIPIQTVREIIICVSRDTWAHVLPKLASSAMKRPPPTKSETKKTNHQILPSKVRKRPGERATRPPLQVDHEEPEPPAEGIIFSNHSAHQSRKPTGTYSRFTNGLRPYLSWEVEVEAEERKLLDFIHVLRTLHIIFSVRLK